MSSPRVSFVSLGCPKALVDSERIITQACAPKATRSRASTTAPTSWWSTPAASSTRATRRVARGHRRGAQENGKVIVTGCLGATPELIRDSIRTCWRSPVRTTTRAWWPRCTSTCRRRTIRSSTCVPPQGVRLTPRHYAYLKISEGCNNRCTFCIIPALRGDLVSRPAADVLREAETLVKAGVKELLVISQDTSAYGVDLKYATSECRGARGRDAQFLDLVARTRRTRRVGAPALRLPLPARRRGDPADGRGQDPAVSRHAVPARLPARAEEHAPPGHAKRRSSASAAGATLCPELTIRSTFIVGFPGETEEDFEMLLDWLDEAKIDRVGCFKYEPVTGRRSTTSACEQVPEEVKEARWHRFMQRAAEDFGRAAEEEGRQAPAGHHRRN